MVSFMDGQKSYSPREPAPPVAGERPHSFTRHGETIEDPWHWLRDAGYPTVEDPDVLGYLAAENDYFEARMSPHRELTDVIFEEIKARQQPDLSSVPWKRDDWYYQWRYEEGGQYRAWLRWPAGGPDAREAPTADAQNILDEPALAKDLDYFSLGSVSVSNDGSLLAYSTDTNGSERFRMVVKNLSTGDLLGDEIEDTIGSAVWAADDASFFYTVVDENWRPREVRRHVLGGLSKRTPSSTSRTTPDSSFAYLSQRPGNTSSSVLATSSHPRSGSSPRPYPTRSRSWSRRAGPVTSTRWTTRATDSSSAPTTGTRTPGWRLHPPTTRLSQPGTPLVDASDSHYIRGFEAFQDFIAVEERIDGLDHVRLIDRADESTYIPFPEATYTAYVGTNEEFQADTVRLEYTSMVTPSTVFDYHIGIGDLETRQVQRIPSGYDASQYVTERVVATARDGVQVPVSVVCRRDTPADGTAPLYIYAYGSYGYAVPPSFSASRLSLLDRGFIFAIAHVRGGDDLGYHWYEAGKLDRRTNTFNDFVDVARSLIAQGYGSEGRVAISGGSAGGQVMGAVVNQAPGLWGAVAAHVPFVDVLNTILDDTLPLTPIEWPEWGNPIEDKAAFEYIRSYSPYDQLEPRDYPPMLVTAGLNDPRVTYWEPAKYVAKLRKLKTDDNVVLLKTNMGAGHRGKSGRYDSLYEVAEEYTFFLSTGDCRSTPI